MSQQIIDGIDGILSVLSGKRFLLVKGSSFDRLEIKSKFDGLDYIPFSEFTPNPLYEQVCEGVKAFCDNNCEMIVAVGGGSAIDVAKCIKLYAKMNPAVNYLQQEMFDSEIPLIAVPTTAGTGSESTRHAVIYYEGVKQSVSHPSIVPDYAVLEPNVLLLLPLYQKKCTMLDALCQAIESWWSVSSTEESIEYSKKAISLIKDNWQAYILDNRIEAANDIMLAANYAGRAINITATTAAHAMSYKLTSLYKLPHGHAVAISMCEVWKYMLDNTDKCIDARGEEHLKKVFDDISKIIDYDWFVSLLESLEIDSPKSENVNTDLEILVKSVNPTRLKNNPVELTETVLHDMYERIVK